MKVLFNPQISNKKNSNRINFVMKNDKEQSKISITQMPNYEQIGTMLNQVSFGAKKVSITNQKLLNAIESLKREKQSLMSRTFSEEVRKAQNILYKLRNWSDSRAYEEASKEANRLAEKAKDKYEKEHGAVYRFFHKSSSSVYVSEYNSQMNKLYYAKRDEIAELRKNESNYRTIVDLSTSGEVDRQRRIQEIDKLIEANSRLINYQGLQDDINEMLSAKGGLTDRIAGYEEEKGEINAKFVQLLAKSKEDYTTEVPSAILLYGPTGTGKTTFLHGIMDQSKDYAYFVDLSSFKTAASFKKMLDDSLMKADKRFREENKRTVILLNDAEDIFTVSEAEAKILGVTLDGQDRTIINASHNSFENVSNFKQLLDTVSKVPDGNQEGGRHATTFFITTNYPHLIHPDLLSREGKMTKIAIGLAKDNNIAEVLRFYFKEMENVSQRLRELKNNPDYENFIDSIAGFTDKGKANLKKLIKTGEIECLQVDWQHMPYDTLAKAMNPNTKLGAYSNDALRVICQKAYLNYLEKNPAEDDYKTSFYKAYKETKRDINPERLKKFNLIDKMIKDETISIEDIDELLEQRDLGLLSEKQANLLQYHITKIETELESLMEREVAAELTIEEKTKKAELLNLKEKIEEKKEEDYSSTDFE